MPLHRDLESLKPGAQDAFKRFFAALDAASVDYFVNETYREQAVQDAYYARGRKDAAEVDRLYAAAGLPKPDAYSKITWTTRSLHTAGKAADIYPKSKGKVLFAGSAADFAAIAKVGKEIAELEWGGDWEEAKRDLPHWQMKST